MFILTSTRINTLIINVIKLYAKPLCTNINIAEITLMNDKIPV